MRYLETIKIENGIILNINLHQQRIVRTIGKFLHIDIPVPDEYKIGVVKMRIVYDKDSINEISYSHYTLPNIHTLKLVDCDLVNSDVENNLNSNVKNNLNSDVENNLNSDVEKQINSNIKYNIEYDFKYENRDCINNLMIQKGDCDDILILRNGLISDTSFCNVIFENREGFFTPKRPLLKGVKRELLIKDKVIEELDITMDNIQSYDNIILINAMIEFNEISIDIKNISQS